MVITALLFALLMVAAVTDWRRRMIYNWTVYPGILAALALAALGTWFRFDAAGGNEAQRRWWGLVGLWESGAGLLLCGGVMLVCFVFAPLGELGGGDVKLIAMIGAFLGPYQGLEAMLWTFVLGGCLALAVLVWRVGAWRLLTRAVRYAALAARWGRAAPLSEQERRTLQAPLFLAPSAIAAVAIVRFELIEWLRF